MSRKNTKRHIIDVEQSKYGNDFDFFCHVNNIFERPKRGREKLVLKLSQYASKFSQYSLYLCILTNLLGPKWKALGLLKRLD